MREITILLLLISLLSGCSKQESASPSEIPSSDVVNATVAALRELESPADVSRRRGRRAGDVKQFKHGPKSERPAKPDASSEAGAS